MEGGGKERGGPPPPWWKVSERKSGGRFCFLNTEGCVCVCALATLSPSPFLSSSSNCFRSRSRLVRRKFGLMVGGLSRMFRIFNGRIKEGRIGEGEKVFYLGAIKGVGGLPKWSNALDFRWVGR